MPWQIQVRRKIDGEEWEPISVERCRKIGDTHERQYNYESVYEAKQAFAEYVDIEGGLPNLLIRMATGRPKFTDHYAVRFVQLWPEDQQPASGPGGFAAVPPGSESALRWNVEQPPADAYEHHGLPTGHYWVWYEGDWITGNWDGEDWNLANGVTTSPRHLFRGPRIADPPTGGPPTPDLAAQPDSTAQNTERQACIADIRAAFWGDEYITDRYDIAQFILDRIAKREEKENA
jgi:hypothetical protein